MLIGFDQTLCRLAMPWIRNSWPRLIGLQPKATEIVSTEDSLCRRNGTIDKEQKYVSPGFQYIIRPGGHVTPET